MENVKFLKKDRKPLKIAVTFSLKIFVLITASTNYNNQPISLTFFFKTSKMECLLIFF